MTKKSKLIPAKTKTGTPPKTIEGKRKLVEKVLKDYTEGGLDDNGNPIKYTFTSCCVNNGISAKTFYNWCDKDSIISKRLKEAQELNAKTDLKDLTARATQGLVFLTQGQYITERTVVTEEIFDAKGNKKGKKVRAEEHVRFLKPNAAACIFVKKNSDPEYFNEENQAEETKEDQVFKLNGQTIKF